MDFLAIWGCETHFKSELFYAEFTRDRPKQIFGVERRFQRSKSQISRFKETCARGHQIAVPHKSRYFTVVGKSAVKTVADRHGYAAYHNKLL